MVPMSFEVNQGQTNTQVQFLTHGSGYALFLTHEGSMLSLEQPSASAGQPFVLPCQRGQPFIFAGQCHRGGFGHATGWRTQQAAVTGEDLLPGTSNYLIGNDPSQWHTDIPNYGQVEEQSVYPGVDLVYYGNQQQLEYNFTVAPGADPGSSGWPSRGRSRRRSTPRATSCSRRPGPRGGAGPGALPGGRRRPPGRRGAVSCWSENEVGFAVGNYDPSQPLVIDPTLSLFHRISAAAAMIMAWESPWTRPATPT